MVDTKKTEWLQWIFPKNWFQKEADIPRDLKDFQFLKMMDQMAAELLENASLAFQNADTVIYNEIPQTVTWGVLRIASPASGAVVTITGSGIGAPTDGVLYIAPEKRLLKSGNEAMKFGTPKEARKKGNIPLGVIDSDTLYFRGC